jgi:hypothetical protein
MREAAARGEPPQATLLRDIQVGDAGIWVLMDRTNPLWRPPADHDPAERLSFSDVEARVDHVLQLLQPATGEPIATLEDSGAGRLLGFLDAGVVFAMRETAEGGLEIVVLAAAVER